MSDLRVLVLNVTSLPKKFRHLLSIPCHVFALSEVRTPRPTVSLSTQDNFLGFSVIWSCPPPPSATWSVSLGGTALFVKRPLTESTSVRKVETKRTSLRWTSVGCKRDKCYHDQCVWDTSWTSGQRAE